MPGSIPSGDVPEPNPEPWWDEQVIPQEMRTLSNAEIADRLARLAQLLAAQNENPYKVKAYRRAAANVRAFSQSVDELVRDDADVTALPGIGEGIGATLREIVLTGTLGKLEKLRAQASPEADDRAGCVAVSL